MKRLKTITTTENKSCGRSLGPEESIVLKSRQKRQWTNGELNKERITAKQPLGERGRSTSSPDLSEMEMIRERGPYKGRFLCRLFLIRAPLHSKYSSIAEVTLCDMNYVYFLKRK